MTKEKLWDVIASKNPLFKSQGAHFTAAGLDKFFNQVWGVAYSEGLKNGKALAEMKESPVDSIFNMMGVKR